MKKYWILGVVPLVGVGLWWYGTLPTGSVMAETNGLHAHPIVEIYVSGERIEIPTEIGVGPQYADLPKYGMGGMAMTPIHTHKDVPIIHLEFSGPVSDEDIELRRFFEVWGRDIGSFGALSLMEVNGEVSTTYGSHVMRDGDIIKLFYE